MNSFPFFTSNHSSTSKKATKYRRLHGFTLIEMLVVIAIIALLVTLLGGVTTRARNHSKKINCAGNLRQLGVVILSYATEHEGWLPAQGNNPVFNSWSHLVFNYVGDSWPSINQRTIQLCPSAFDTYPDGKVYRSYMMNFAGYNWKTATPIYNHTRPSMSVLLMDSAHRQGGDCYGGFKGDDFLWTGDFRHSGGINTVFLDGHVQWFGPNQMDELKTAIVEFGK
ncbi:type II secretion system protein [Kiritimatiellota bacterium B12222]|nr:type II secretion system protein [Kiritimatiellota bacterium B12222]